HGEVQGFGLESHLIAPDNQRMEGVNAGHSASNRVGHAARLVLDGDAETAWNQAVKLGLDGLDRRVRSNCKNEARTAGGKQIEEPGEDGTAGDRVQDFGQMPVQACASA